MAPPIVHVKNNSYTLDFGCLSNTRGVTSFRFHRTVEADKNECAFIPERLSCKLISLRP
jgi:hypothetical protein